MRLYSSAQATTKLRHLGYAPRHEVTGAPKSKSPDWMWTKIVLDANGKKVRTLNASVPMNEKQIARGTMKAILDLLEITEIDFENA